MTEYADRYVGLMAEPHFDVAEHPMGVMLELDRGVSVIVLGSQAAEDENEQPTLALCQVTFQGEPAAVYVPWEKISLQGKQRFRMVDGGLPFPSVR